MKRLIKGNEAIVLGALAAKCDAFFGYPITPASEISQLAAEYFPKFGKTFLQAECEIGAINMVYGAVSCGRRAMTSSSGPGISLKQEGISFLAGAELPAVIADIMRAGPGLGNIGPEQSDYNQVVKGGGHGGYRTIVLAPNSANEMYRFTIDAFRLADTYRTPVYLLADATLGQMMEPVELDDSPECGRGAHIPKPWKVDTTPETNGNLITSIDLDFSLMEVRSRKLAEKFEQVDQNEMRYETFETEDAEVIVTGYGIISRILRSVVELLRRDGHKIGMIRPQTLSPFPKNAYRDAVRKNPNVRFLVVELSHGLFAEDVIRYVAPAPVAQYNRLGGNLPTEKEIIEQIVFDERVKI